MKVCVTKKKKKKKAIGVSGKGLGIRKGKYYLNAKKEKEIYKNATWS